jgi:hypothetical protein
MAQHGIEIPIKEAKVGAGAERFKIERIRTILQPKWKRDEIHIRKGLGDFVHQLDEFPELDYFDILDSLCQHKAIAVRPTSEEVEAAALGEEEPAEDEKEAAEPRTLSGYWGGPMTTPL